MEGIFSFFSMDIQLKIFIVINDGGVIIIISLQVYPSYSVSIVILNVVTFPLF